MPKPTRKSAGLPLEQRIEDDPFARAALKTLLARGARQGELWSHLHSLETSQLLGFANWNQRSRLTKRQAKALAARLTSDAHEIRAFFAPDLYWYLTVEHNFGWIELVEKYLKSMGHLIEEMLLTSDDRGHDDGKPARMRLTQYVRRATGRPHDQEVADLVRVTLCLDAYTAEEQRKFRTRPSKSGRI